MKIIQVFFITLFFTLSFNVVCANTADKTTFSKNTKTQKLNKDVQPIISNEGHVIASASLMYLQPSLSDAGLQYGTFLTITPLPPTLTTSIRNVVPQERPSYRLMFGYQLPNSDNDIRLSYFNFDHGYHSATNTSVRNAQAFQFMQTYLGNSFASAVASSAIDVQQLNLTFGHHLLIGKDLYLHPFVGLSYGQVNTNLFNVFNTLIVNPFGFPNIRPPANGKMSGLNKSHFGGVGPIIGTDFTFPIGHHLSFIGGVNTAFLIGDVNYSLSSSFVGGNQALNYSAVKSDKSKIVPVINSDLGLRYSHPIKDEPYSAVVEAGYQVSDFMNASGRLYPINGYSNNPAGSNPTAVGILSSVGFDGPFVRLALLQSNKNQNNNDYATYPSQLFNPGWFANLTNLILRPIGSVNDLNYALLNTSNGAVIGIHAKTNYHWAGDVGIGYRFSNNNTDIELNYSHLNTSDNGAIAASPGQSISSLNSSGAGGVVYSNATSNIKYKFDRVDLTVGKYFNIHNMLLRLFTGISIARIEREQTNTYTGGIPNKTAESKFPRLKSNFIGVGPLFGLSDQIPFSNHISLIAYGNVGILVGNTKSTVKFRGVGATGVSSYTDLTTQNKRYIVPNVTGKLALQYSSALHDGMHFQASAGFQASDYFKAINLVYPVFRTGLQQTNTNYIMVGPYVTLSITGI